MTNGQTQRCASPSELPFRVDVHARRLRTGVGRAHSCRGGPRTHAVSRVIMRPARLAFGNDYHDAHNTALLYQQFNRA